MDDEDEELPTCPLCLEELDTTDRAVKACQCGYQVCLWCLHHIREQLSARCPACRTPYEEQNFKFDQVNPEQAAKEAKERATAKKERERREKLREIERERERAALVSQQKAKNNLKHVRILQRNLVYVIGLSLTLAREEVIRRADMFGKFGRMLRILVNRAHPFNADAPGGPSISAYVQYYRDSDASAAVRGMNNAVFDGREIRCAIATTKYCDVFVRSVNASDPNPTSALHCGNSQCMYYHSISPPEIVLTKEEVLTRQLGPPPPAHLFLVDPRRATMQPLQFQRTAPPNTGPIPLSALPNSSVPGAPSVLLSGVQPSLTSAAGNNASSSMAIPSIATVPPANSSIMQPPLASSPPLHSAALFGAGRKSPIQMHASSPQPSPQRTPPSSPGLRQSTMRLGRSPVGTKELPSTSVAQTSLSVAAPAPATATSAPFMSASSSNPQLPSTAGWASAQKGRSSSRSPSRRGPSTSSLDDPARARPRIQMRRRESNAPPGFEDSSNTAQPPVPSRPPGFDAPAGNHSSRGQGQGSARSTALPSGSASPPPGFGPGPATAKDGAVEGPLATDVAAVWSQEASADKIFSTNDRRARRPVGVPPQRIMQDVNDGADSREELAQVLAKIGGDLGVSSEFQDVKNIPNTGNLAGDGDGNVPQPGLGSLFTEGSIRNGYGAQSTTNSSQQDTRVSAKPPASHRSAVASVSGGIAQGSSASVRPEMLRSRRNTSRFNFARSTGHERKSRDLAASVQPSRPPALASMTGVSPRALEKGESLSSSNGSRMKAHVVSEVTRSAGNMYSVIGSVPQRRRQPRSRFDFVDHDSSPPRTQQLDSVGLGLDPAVQNIVPLDADPSSDAFGATFAKLTTAEKLASIFSSAEWSAERLPPMPSYEQQLDEEIGPRREHPVAPQNTPALASSSSLAMASDAMNGTEDSQRLEISQSQNNQFAPPGFREATPGISPETTVGDKSSTTTGVAATRVASGVVGPGGVNSATSGQTEDIPSSGTESFEEDRKRSRTQRKRDKKARQLKESSERNVDEALSYVPQDAAAGDVETLGKASDQRVATMSPGLREITNPSSGQILSKPKDVPAPLKSVLVAEDPGKFMSVSELEREVQAARAREAQLQDRLLELQRRISSYDNVRT